jgi:HEAT repeat protein
MLWIMNDKHRSRPNSMTAEAEVKRERGRPLQTGVRTLIVLVASCGVVFWAARYLWERQHPAFSVASGLKARDIADRVNATRMLAQTGIGDAQIAIPPLIVALRDPAASVRVAACDALRSRRERRRLARSSM